MALYTGALVASRCNPVVLAFDQRMLTAGKSKGVALTARMGKLLVILNSMVKIGGRWQPDTNVA